ncbi:PREDICTED: ATP-dependent DNA helicase homolog RECG, chloroplastic [Nelumbo nucifera]|uniref:ATP-dependent DNA helicase homolog RECG, chloroplastic n=1 Tax=Nelumbo nucifera TaxID=4432 RepID=A0A1U8B1S2_NELNU|nr:PREDICTED: ATP-dependent DNA helicase homolog RECG, chloroplastic [Nelumbo nucifera]XP_010274669.1 PREDICTED: ATP-dependent DNA helicase homolog RECG, chloroplastic [Nelumbo nucifera]XP_010274670.1 PREDICTED: ATP-dependent DNA helicase homolog RECG, chloroplastic [Nelumbo nucifera]XP_010274671.1 PREDICTED: ATP-dependent DNA helicase homolog RECG, chloroplastic [Nelumbo nucifera]
MALMASMASVVPSCSLVYCQCFNEKHLRGAISFEAQQGYRNAFGRKMRFSNFLYSKLSKLCSRSNHKFAQKLLEEVNSYGTASISDRSKLLHKVSILMGYNNVEDLIENERDRRESDEYLKDAMDEIDVSLSYKRFPSIILGSSPLVELYKETEFQMERMELLPDQSYDGSLSSSMGMKLVEPDGPSETGASLDCPVSKVNSSSSSDEENSVVLPSFPQPMALDTNMKSDAKTIIKESSTNVRPESEQDVASLEHILDKPISQILGLRKKYCQQLEKCGFHTIRKLLHHFPRTYADTRNAQGEINDGDYLIFIGKVLSSRGIRANASFSFLEVVVGCEIIKGKVSSEVNSGDLDCMQKKMIYLHLKKFFRGTRFANHHFLRILQSKHKEGDLVCISGKAYVGIHRPTDLNEADLARRRLIFDEFFYLQLARLFQMLEALGTRIEKIGLLDKFRKDELNTVLIDDWSNLTKKMLKALPYSLTPSQLDAVSEIIWDLKRPVPMNRLLQGDVGCGKTVVAFLACMEVIGSGYQAAFMVPTELLAIQHYEHFLSLLENMEEDQFKPSVSLLTGSTSSKQARIIRQGLQSGDISLVIGTHSLIADKVDFSALRIAVVDEQHRFGVIQRGRFNNKLYSACASLRAGAANTDGSSTNDAYMAPHVLALTATPIPRTLALALYGDMSLTQITDVPPGRIPVETCTFEGNENGFENVYQMMQDELQKGGKVYLVYPIIDESEQLPQLRAASSDLETIACKFKGYNCGLLHGRMKIDEKDEALRRFRSGETRILLSTQVIEIGVDVPDASMIVIMNAERFGIAQLHQLRGRVGRGARKSRCIFLSSTASGLNRLKVLEKSSDGFYLANVDLLHRGPGDLLGKKQSGHLPEFPVARLEVDGNILQDAHLAALKILTISHDLEQFPKLKAELSMRQPLCLLGD